MINQEASNRLKQWMRNGCDGMTDERLGYIEGWFHKSDKEAFELAISALEQEPKSPCDLCRYNPPSSADGKPCTMCPATGRSDKENDKD